MHTWCRVGDDQFNRTLLQGAAAVVTGVAVDGEPVRVRGKDGRAAFADSDQDGLPPGRDEINAADWVTLSEA